jgi:hypothetical protein
VVLLLLIALFLLHLRLPALRRLLALRLLLVRGGVCADASGTISLVMASAIASDITFAERFMRPSFRLSVKGQLSLLLLR